MPNRNVRHLNAFLRSEIAAVETYRIAVDKLDYGSAAREQLESCQRSHQERVEILRREIEAAGGVPERAAPPWDALTRRVEPGSGVDRVKVAIDALEEGEDHELRGYRDDVADLDPTSKLILASQLLPRQQETHRAILELKKQLH